MYTGGPPPKFRGPIPTKEEIPDGPPSSAPPPAPGNSNPRSSGSSRSFKSKSLRIQPPKFGTLRMKKKSSLVRSSQQQIKNESSVLSLAEKNREEEKKKMEEPPIKLVHNTAGRPLRGTASRGVRGAPRGARGGRRPPSRKPLGERKTPLQSTADSPSISLVAERKPPPPDIPLTLRQTMPEKPQPPKSIAPLIDEKAMETKKIEQEKRKSSMQKVGTKTVLRVFLDTTGTGFKTIAVPLPCDMYSLVKLMKKKVFSDTTGFGIYEARDGKDVGLLHPEDDVTTVMNKWKDDKLYRLVFKRALGNYASLYLDGPSSKETPSVPLPEKPSLPSKPGPPPAKPSKPEIQGMPGMPPKPTLPSKLDNNTPDMPPKPSLPSKPAKPSKPEMPEMPGMPPKPSKPTLPTSIKADQPDQSSMPPKPTKPSLNSKNPLAALKNRPRPQSTRRAPPPKPESSLPLSNNPAPFARPSKPRPVSVQKPLVPNAFENSPPRGPPQKPEQPSFSGGSSRRGPPSAIPPRPGNPNTSGSPSPLGKPRPMSARGTFPRGRGGSPFGTRKTPHALPPKSMQLTPAPIQEPTPEPLPPKPTPVPVQEPTPEPLPPKPTKPAPVPTSTVSASSVPSDPKSKPIQEWSVEEVGEWICSIGFEKMKKCFVENYISGMELVELTNQELKDDLGVAALGARKAILREISKLS